MVGIGVRVGFGIKFGLDTGVWWNILLNSDVKKIIKTNSLILKFYIFKLTEF